jgi:glucose dehydrogenase
MKTIPIWFAGTIGLLVLAAVSGCKTDYGRGSPTQPGPVAGKTVGAGAGVVAGNVVGAGSGVVSGTAAGYSKAMDPSYHMVRYWRTETTPDGRTIQVPYDVMVDQYGRPMTMPAPTGNSKPPAAIVTNTPVN